jgi:hypothetical protein
LACDISFARSRFDENFTCCRLVLLVSTGVDSGRCAICGFLLCFGDVCVVYFVVSVGEAEGAYEDCVERFG